MNLRSQQCVRDRTRKQLLGRLSSVGRLNLSEKTRQIGHSLGSYVSWFCMIYIGIVMNTGLVRETRSSIRQFWKRPGFSASRIVRSERGYYR